MKKIRSLFRFLSYAWQERILPVFLVFAHDIKRIVRNRSAFIVILGLCVLPCLYAWVNIYACWDPYSKTGDLPIAIVNNDQGAVFNGKIVNVGESVIDILNDNDTIDWNIVDSWQGNYGLYQGNYYAMIEIPQNFTQGLLSMASTTPQKPVITYKINEKLNAIASKIANAAQTKLVQNIESNFVKTVSEEAIHQLKLETDKFSMNDLQLNEIKATLTQSNEDIRKLRDHINDSNAKAEDFQRYLSQSPATFARLSQQMEALQTITQANRALTDHTKQTVQSISSDLNYDVNQLQTLDSLNQQMLAQLKGINNNTLDEDIIGTMEQTKEILRSTDVILTADRDNLNSLDKTYNLSGLKLLSASLDYLSDLLTLEIAALDKQIPLLKADHSDSALKTALDSLSKISSEMTSKIQALSNAYYAQGAPLLNSLVRNLNLQMEGISEVLEINQTLVPQLNALATYGGASSGLSIQQANHLSSRLEDLQSKLNELVNKMDEVQNNENVQNLLDLFENRPSEMSDFLSSPIVVEKSNVFEETTFGEGLTPFYTVLAIWVGALLSCALLSVESDAKLAGRKLNLKQRHFGKMLLFLVISLIQSTLITLGNVFLLGVRPANWLLMMGTGILCSITFVVIIFTLVSLFGNVGKGVAALIMVLQIAGSGGIYPVQTNPAIFGKLHFLWPFTYAIDNFREAIAGPVWPSVANNIRAMLFFIVAFLLFASLKKPLHHLNITMEEKFKEAKI